MERKISMKNIYSTSNSVEADAVISKLTDEGIHADCRREDKFNAVSGKNNIEFNIFVDDREADKAKKLIDGNEYEQSNTSTAGRKRMIVRATVIIGLICAAAAIVLSVISSIM